MKETMLISLLLLCSMFFLGQPQTYAQVNLILNGDFELGDFTGWTVNNVLNQGSWRISTPGANTPFFGWPTLNNSFGGGNYYAVADKFAPDAMVLLQPFTVPMPAASAILSFDMFVNDWDLYGGYIHPNGLDPYANPNQHARVDILSAGADPFDTGAGVLANYYLGVYGTGAPYPYVHYTFDVTSLIGGGGDFQLRFGQVQTEYFLNTGVDNVRIDYTPIPEPGTFTLCGIGVLGLIGYGWRRRRKA